MRIMSPGTVQVELVLSWDNKVGQSTFDIPSSLIFL